tara:strand:+ start:231 stop:704 length:474 start_codon:yes stop_codon:yes gene_type:complete
MDLSNLQDNVAIREDFISLEKCIQWLQRVPAPFLVDNKNLSWEHRIIDITTHPITQQVTDFWNSCFKINSLKIHKTLIQLWPINSESIPHIHVRNNQTTYNSMLYLNDNYTGGEFYTDKITITPKPGMLTFFNGQKTYHGVKPIHLHNRYTIAFWFE